MVNDGKRRGTGIDSYHTLINKYLKESFPNKSHISYQTTVLKKVFNEMLVNQKN